MTLMDSLSKFDVYDDAISIGFSHDEAVIIAEDKVLQKYYDDSLVNALQGYYGTLLDTCTAPEALQELRKIMMEALDTNQLRIALADDTVTATEIAREILNNEMV